VADGRYLTNYIDSCVTLEYDTKEDTLVIYCPGVRFDLTRRQTEELARFLYAVSAADFGAVIAQESNSRIKRRVHGRDESKA
jgi:hypothetical protein